MNHVSGTRQNEQTCLNGHGSKNYSFRNYEMFLLV